MALCRSVLPSRSIVHGSALRCKGYFQLKSRPCCNARDDYNCEASSASRCRFPYNRSGRQYRTLLRGAAGDGPPTTVRLLLGAVRWMLKPQIVWDRPHCTIQQFPVTLKALKCSYIRGRMLWPLIRIKMYLCPRPWDIEDPKRPPSVTSRYSHSGYSSLSRVESVFRL